MEVGHTLGKLVGEFRTLGARSDEAEVSSEHVYDLWKLVQRAITQHATHGRDPRVVFRRPHRAAHLLGIGHHRSELVDLEHTSALTQPRLGVEYGATVVQPDRQGDERPKGDPEGGEDYVHHDEYRKVKRPLPPISDGVSRAGVAWDRSRAGTAGAWRAHAAKVRLGRWLQKPAHIPGRSRSTGAVREPNFNTGEPGVRRLRGILLRETRAGAGAVEVSVL